MALLLKLAKKLGLLGERRIIASSEPPMTNIILTDADLKWVIRESKAEDGADTVICAQYILDMRNRLGQRVSTIKIK